MSKQRAARLLAGLLCACMALAGCGSRSSSAMSLSQKTAAVEQTIQKTAQAILAGKWQNARAAFSRQLKQQLSASQLQQGYESAAANLTLNGLDHTELVSAQDPAAGYAYISYQEKTLKIYMQFDSSLQLTRLIINEKKELPALISDDVCSEQAVAVGNAPQLNGILCLPAGTANPPVAVLVAGSGPLDCNETVGGSQVFADLAYGLAQYGIASLRFDKRYYDDPELIKDNSEATVDQEYMYDIAAAVHMLEQYPVNAGNIIYIGHSEGAMLAYAAAAQHFEISRMVLLAGTARSLADLIYDQTKNALSRQGLSDSQMAAQLQPIAAAQIEIAALSADSESKTILGLGSTYWYQLNQYQATHYIDTVKIPTLILQGEADTQVFYETDYALWQDLLKGKSNAVLKSYPGLNHLFCDSSVQPDGDYSAAAHVSSEVIQDIADWIAGQDILKEDEAAKQ